MVALLDVLNDLEENSIDAMSSNKPPCPFLFQSQTSMSQNLEMIIVNATTGHSSRKNIKLLPQFQVEES